MSILINPNDNKDLFDDKTDDYECDYWALMGWRLACFKKKHENHVAPLLIVSFDRTKPGR